MSGPKALFHWLAEARYTWVALGVILVAMVVSLRPQTPESVIRLTGLVLQVLGIATVIWGISATRALFGRPSLASKLGSWLGRCPLLRKNVTIAVGAASLSISGCRAKAHNTHRPGPDPTIEARIESLERNVVLIHDRISNTQKEMDNEFRKMSESLMGEEHTRKIEDDAIRERLEATGTGGVHISAIGAAWLFVGVVLSTAAIEIAHLLQ